MSQICEYGQRRRVTQGQDENSIQIQVLGNNRIKSAQKRPRGKSTSRTRSINQEKEDLKIEELTNKLGDLKKQMLEKNKHLLNQERQLREQIVFEQEALAKEIKEKQNLKIEYSNFLESNQIKENEMLKIIGEAKGHISTLKREVENLRTRNSELQEGLTNEGKKKHSLQGSARLPVSAPVR